MIKVTTKGIMEFERFVERAPGAAREAARMAINDVVTGSGMKLIQKSMMAQVAFPAGYLTGDRLRVIKRATNQNLEAAIVGRKRATSLARFASGASIMGKQGVRVRVQKGRATYMKNAWLVRLKAGASLTEDNYNIGLALRIRPGERINKKTTHQSWLEPGRVALLYGPSVDQVFREVAYSVDEPIAIMVTDEFFRQFARLTRG